MESSQVQAQQWAVQIERGKPGFPANDLHPAVKACHQVAQRCRNLEEHLGAALREEGRITAELNCIAKSLFAVQQNGLACHTVAAKPKRLPKIWLGRFESTATRICSTRVHSRP
jgi:hypothetical protein